MSNHRVPSRLAGKRGPQNRSSSRRSHSVSASQHAPHWRGACKVNSESRTCTTSQSSPRLFPIPSPPPSRRTLLQPQPAPAGTIPSEFPEHHVTSQQHKSMNSQPAVATIGTSSLSGEAPHGRSLRTAGSRWRARTVGSISAYNDAPEQPASPAAWASAGPSRHGLCKVRVSRIAARRRGAPRTRDRRGQSRRPCRRSSPAEWPASPAPPDRPLPDRRL